MTARILGIYNIKYILVYTDTEPSSHKDHCGNNAREQSEGGGYETSRNEGTEEGKHLEGSVCRTVPFNTCILSSSVPFEN